VSGRWPGPVWKGETVFIIGGGFSLTHEIAARIAGRPSIVINAAARIATEASYLLFSDLSFFEAYRPLLGQWRRRVMTTNATAARRDGGLVLVPPEALPPFDRLSTGHLAVSVATALGAARVVLVAFDARVREDGRSHAVDDYSRTPRIYEKFVRDWGPTAIRAAAASVDLINATPGSAIPDRFVRGVALDDIL
jgi:hypothetical protein